MSIDWCLRCRTYHFTNSRGVKDRCFPTWKILSIYSRTNPAPENYEEESSTVVARDSEDAIETWVSDLCEGDVSVPMYVAILEDGEWVRYRVQGEYTITWSSDQIDNEEEFKG